MGCRSKCRSIYRNILFWYRHWRVEVYIVSYPRSGRTILRVLLYGCKLLKLDIPNVGFTHDGTDKGHRHGIDYSRYRNKKVVFLVRDPRDIITSWYHYHVARYGLEGSLDDFIRDRYWGIDSVVEFLEESQKKYRKNSKEFISLRYEDFVREPNAYIRNFLNFLGVTATDRQVKALVQLTSFKSMKQISDGSSEKLKAKLRLYRGKLRKGKIGSYADELSGENLRYVNAKVGVCEF